MDTPTTFLLNVRGLDWLEAEANKWFAIYASATGQDKEDAKAYLSQVIAERDQRVQQYQGGAAGAAGAGLTALFEMFGGSAGPGAQGVAAEVVATSKAVAKTAASGAKTVLTTAAVVAIIVGGIWAYGKSKQGGKRAAA